MTTLKNHVKSTAHAMELELRRFSPATSEMAQLKAMFAAQSVDLVLDVGANVGQFVPYLGSVSSLTVL
jgi:diadenosine tetraphosphate (Ap4A) HIT family hydrolase